MLSWLNQMSWIAFASSRFVHGVLPRTESVMFLKLWKPVIWDSGESFHIQNIENLKRYTTARILMERPDTFVFCSLDAGLSLSICCEQNAHHKRLLSLQYPGHMSRLEEMEESFSEWHRSQFPNVFLY